MATVPGIKYGEDSIAGYSAANSFPVRSLLRQGQEEDAEGAWLVAHRAEQRKRFKAILCNKPRTYARIKEERRRADKQGTSISEQNLDEEEEEEEAPILDGFFLMRHCCVEDPTDLCSVNINGQEMSEVKEEDLALFDNVAYVNASENYLPLEAFRGFPILRELEMPLNGLRSVHFNREDYPNLEVLDLSYNNLSSDDVLTLGLLPNLKVLHLTGNNLHSLPQNMALPHYDEVSKTETLRYAKLEILLLDDNNLSDVSVFAALAGISRLKHLNMEKNEIFYVPMLKSVEGKVVPNDNEKEKRRLRRSAKKSGRQSRGYKGVTPRSSRLTETNGISARLTETPKPTPQPTQVSVEPLALSPITTKLEPKKQDGVNGNGDLLNEDLTNLTDQFKDINLDTEITLDGALDTPLDSKATLSEGPGLPPFPDLRLLNLAHNKIEDEEALLAVAAWPMLVEIVIHHNPLTTENSGDPPLLKRFLTERLGIKILRKDETESVKPTVEVKMKKERVVSSVVPKIPKVSVDDLLMLEAPKPPSQPKPEKTRTRSDLHKPLPTIPASPDTAKESLATGRSEEPVEATSRRTETQGEAEDAFFMTQVDDQEAEPVEKPKSRKKKHRHRQKKDEKYKGFEILLDAEEDKDYCPPKDMQGNIKALKYALGHELIYRDPTARLDRISKPVEPYRKTEVPMGPPRVTQAEKKDRLLESLRTRNTTEEVGLDQVMSRSQPQLHRKFPEAQKLLGEIQRRYNTVRVNSMKEAKDAKQQVPIHEARKPRSGLRHVQMEV